MDVRPMDLVSALCTLRPHESVNIMSLLRESGGDRQAFTHKIRAHYPGALLFDAVMMLWGLPSGDITGVPGAASKLYEHAIRCHAPASTCDQVGCCEMRSMFSVLRQHYIVCPQPNDCGTCRHAQRVRDAIRCARADRKPKLACQPKPAASIPSSQGCSALMMLARSALGELNSPHNSPCSSPKTDRPRKRPRVVLAQLSSSGSSPAPAAHKVPLTPTLAMRP